MTNSPQTLSNEGASATIYRDAPLWGDMKTASFGNFSCIDAASGLNLLEEIEARLAAEKFAALIGPMDGDTWHKYRVVSKTDNSPPFLMEPVSGKHDLEAMTSAGFAPIEHYVSSRAVLEDACARKQARISGITITHWDGQNGEQYIGRLFDMSGSAFAGNRFFKPIDRDDFLALYAPVMSMVDPQYVLFAHSSAGDLVGFLFAYPDMAEGPKPGSIIIKTYASNRRGVGHVLADHLHRYALSKGFTQVIHALMHENNTSLAQSRKYNAKIIRQYALMGKHIGEAANK